jgi:CHASE3 domain sensor protein
MNCHIIAALVGIILQLLGAGYLVWQARFTANKLAKYKSNITYDNFSAAIDDLAHEINGQFKQQMRGFLLVGAGSILQFYGAWPT